MRLRHLEVEYVKHALDTPHEISGIL